MPTYLSDPLFQHSQNICSSTTFSPHVLFMDRPLASSESLDKSSEVLFLLFPQLIFCPYKMNKLVLQWLKEISFLRKTT